MDEKAIVRGILEKAAQAEIALDHETWERDMTVDEAIDHISEVDDLYRRGLRKAATISNEFYEDCAAAYGWATPTSREAFSLTQQAGSNVEELFQELEPQRDIEDLFIPPRGMEL